MITAFLERRPDRQEERLGESQDWMRHILRRSLGAFRKVVRFMPMADHRAKAPKDVWHVARIAAIRHEDCGPCLQIIVNEALHEGVASAIVRAALSNDAGALGPRLDLARRFAMAVVAHADESEDLRQQMVAEVGDDALVDLALTIASCKLVDIHT